MSWLSAPPVEIIPALNRLSEVITERYHYMFPSKYTAEESVFEFLPTPSAKDNVKRKISDIRSHIAILYRHHFPVKNFGVWAGNWQPFFKFQDYSEEVKNGITAELTEAGIDPAGFWHTPPHLISDGNFVRACYHLLNNVILYSLHGMNFHTCQARLLKWNGGYDRGEPSVDKIVDTFAHGGTPGCAVYGKYKESLHCEFSRHLWQYPFDTWGNQYSPELQGKWKGRYTTRIQKQLYNHHNRPNYPTASAPQEYDYTVPGVTEISFTGTKSDTALPWHRDITSDLEYYKTWGNYKYYYSMSRQDDNLTEALLNVENFPPPNYKYFD